MINRCLCFLVLSFYCHSLIGQHYTSPFTHYLTINEFDVIDREIDIDTTKKEMRLTTFDNKGDIPTKIVQAYTIMGEVEDLPDGGKGYLLEHKMGKLKYRAMYLPNDGAPYFLMERFEVLADHLERMVRFLLD